jgi:hypothetical protein
MQMHRPGDPQDHIPCFDPSEHIAQMTDPISGGTPPPPEGAGCSRLPVRAPGVVGGDDRGHANINVSMNFIQKDAACENGVFI